MTNRAAGGLSIPLTAPADRLVSPKVAADLIQRGQGLDDVPFGYTHTILDNCVSTGLTLDIFETIMSPCLEPKRQWGTPMTVYGYARVSTTDQSLDIQIAALKAAGCEKIRSEKVSGTSTNGRQELKTLLEFIDAGDVLIVTRIDRLARSIGDLQDIVRALKAKGVALRATEQPIDTSTAAGKAFLDMLGVFAEFETNLRKERQMEGIAKAKAAGVYKGRPASIDTAQVATSRLKAWAHLRSLASSASVAHLSIGLWRVERMRAGYLREAIALLERAQQTEDPREASELVKQAADILALVAELTASDNPDVGVH